MNQPLDKIFDKPVVGLDLETTGLDVSRDRIVSIALVCIERFPSADDNSHVYTLVDPEMPIPAESTAIHRIDDSMVRGKPKFKDICRQVVSYLRDTYLVGFNLLNFDVPILWEELNRAGIVWDVNPAMVIDAGNIFKLKEPRDLEAATKFYIGLEHGRELHNSLVDASSTLEVFVKQMERYEDLRAMKPTELAAFSDYNRGRVDLSGKIVRNAEGIPCYAFGKHQGKPVLDDPSYARWMLDSDFPENTKSALRRLLQPAQSVGAPQPKRT